MYRNVDSCRFPKQKSPRMKNFDYASAHYYFVTICTWNKQCLFGSPGNLNTCGLIAEYGLRNISAHFPGVRIDNYVIMPNHIHIILITEEAGINLSNVIGQYKAFVSRQIHKKQSHLHLWQASFHDHVIRSQTSYEKIWLYIDANPANWKKDCFFTDTVQSQTASAGS